MSRIGKLPIPIPDAVKISVTDGKITVEGSKGNLSHKLPDGIKAKTEEQEVAVEGKTRKMNVLVVERSGDSRELKALHGTTRSIAAGMIKGVVDGFAKRLAIVGVGYSAKLQGRTLELLVGFSNPIRYDLPTGIEVELASATEFTIRGVDKRLVGEVAAQIRAVRPPEPYKGKGIRYSDEVVKRKAGKAFVATG